MGAVLPCKSSKLDLLVACLLQTSQAKICSREALRHEGCVCALLHNCSFFEHSDKDTLLYNAEPMCHHHTCSANHHSVQCLLYHLLGLAVPGLSFSCAVQGLASASGKQKRQRDGTIVVRFLIILY
uniref:Secreted protein n=1 Tax=Oryza punctata TaxID=4537 RepID=A0A0E0JWM2_ORYPU